MNKAQPGLSGFAFAVALLAAPTSSCGVAMKKVQGVAGEVPPSIAILRVKKLDRGTEQISFRVREVAPIREVDPAATHYVVWTHIPGEAPRNHGPLNVTAKRDAKFVTVVSDRAQELFITAEPTSAVPRPTGERLLRSKLRRLTNAELALAACNEDADCHDSQLCSANRCTAIAEVATACRTVHRVQFESGSSRLGAGEYAELDRVARCVKADPTLHVRIEGNADSSGSRKRNLELAAERALAVGAYLAGRGVSAEQLGLVDYGESNPLCITRDEACRSKNRRAMVEVDRPQGRM
jgi:peptidoglycan-associated lipoprotein